MNHINYKKIIIKFEENRGEKLMSNGKDVSKQKRLLLFNQFKKKKLSLHHQKKLLCVEKFLKTNQIVN